MITPKSLTAHRAELARMICADEECAAIYAEKAIDLRRSAEILRAEAAGIDKAIEAYRVASEAALPLVPRPVPRAVASQQVGLGWGEDD